MSAIESYFNKTSKTAKKIEGKYIYINGKKFLDFSSNNFLGLKNDERIKESAKDAIDKFGIDIENNKSSSKYSEVYLKFKKDVTNMKKQEDTVLYNSGYNISSGIIPILLGKDDVIFSDSQNYIDIYQGIYKSNAHLIRYQHNDIENLETKLIKHRKNFKKAMVITDSIFLTDGSQAKFKEIIQLKKLHNFILLADDSNGDGIYGEDGNGITSTSFLSDNIDIVIGYFSRNLGGVGEYVSGKHKYINILLKNSLNMSMLYRIIMSPILISISEKTIELSKKESFRRENVLKLSKHLRNKLKNLNLNIGDTSSHIIPIIFDSNEVTIKLSKFLYNNGIIVATTVGKTTIKPRIKFYINALMEEEDINILLSTLKEFLETSTDKVSIINKNDDASISNEENEENIEKEVEKSQDERIKEETKEIETEVKPIPENNKNDEKIVPKKENKNKEEEMKEKENKNDLENIMFDEDSKKMKESKKTAMESAEKLLDSLD